MRDLIELVRIPKVYSGYVFVENLKTEIGVEEWNGGLNIG